MDRRDTVVPYLIYDDKVQPYWKSLVHFPAVRNGCQALEMTVVFQPKETLIAKLYDSDFINMSFEKFKNSLTDPNDFLYMDMESLYNNIYPVDEVNVEELKRKYDSLDERLMAVKPVFPMNTADGGEAQSNGCQSSIQ